MSEVVFGDKKLIKKLKKLDPKTAKAAIRKGTRAGAKIIQQRAKQTAPKQKGLLRRNIKVRALPRSTKVFGAQVVSEFRNTESYYGAFTEYGYTHRSGRKIAGQHFMEKAADQTGAKAIQVAVDEMKNWIKENT